MKITYVTTYDARDVHSWSGTGKFIAKALSQAGVDLHYIGNLILKRNLINYSWHLISKVSNKKYFPDRELSVAKCYANQYQNLIPTDCDAVFSPGLLPIANLKTNIPIVSYTDSTFGGMVDYYEDFKNLSKRTLHSGHELEALGLNRCSMVIFASEWAAETAIRFYGISPNKIRIIPFGANLINPPSESLVQSAVLSRSNSECNLLFWGVEWSRKRGDFAIRVAEALRSKGVNAILHIVGIRNLPINALPPYIINHGFLSKTSDLEMLKLEHILLSTHFLVLPTIAEAFGIVFCEASAYGIPSFTTRTGGTPTAIRDGVNGYLFDSLATPELYADKIVRYFRDESAYNHFAQSSRQEFIERLNWNSSGSKILEAVSGIVASINRR